MLIASTHPSISDELLLKTEIRSGCHVILCGRAGSDVALASARRWLISDAGLDFPDAPFLFTFSAVTNDAIDTLIFW